MSLKIGCISPIFPPAPNTRAISVSQWVYRSRHQFHVVCENNAGKDPDLLDQIEERLGSRHVITSSMQKPSAGRRTARQKSLTRLYLSLPALVFRVLWQDYRVRVAGFHRSARQLAQHAGPLFSARKLDAVLSLSQPHYAHLAGLEIKKRLRLPWISFWSDPWLDNPYERFKPLSFCYHALWQRQVLQKADAVLFTTEQTRDRVCPEGSSLRSKTRVLSHCFEPDWFPSGPRVRPFPDKCLIRYMGSFYGHRQPAALIRAFHRYAAHFPQRAEQFRFEFYGARAPGNHSGTPVPAQFHFMEQIPFFKSLEKMKEADYLLVMDAPAEKNLFLPGKIAFYLGARRPVWAITPGSGPTADLMRSIPGTLQCPPDDEEAIFRTLDTLYGRHRKKQDEHWELPEAVYNAFKSETVLKKLDEILEETILSAGRRLQ